MGWLEQPWMEVLQLEEWLVAAAFKAPITSQHPLLTVMVPHLGEPNVAGGFGTTVEFRDTFTLLQWHPDSFYVEKEDDTLRHCIDNRLMTKLINKDAFTRVLCYKLQ